MTSHEMPEKCKKAMKNLLESWNEDEEKYANELRKQPRENVVRFIKEYGIDEPDITSEGILSEKIHWTCKSIWEDSFGPNIPFERFDLLDTDQLAFYFLQLENHGNYDADKKVDGKRWNLFDVIGGLFKYT